MNENEVLHYIDKISNDSCLRNSKRSISFLKYICTCCIEGKEDHIKEYSIGVDAFGLMPTFDPQIDPRVRVEASRLRKKLTEYYEREGIDDLIRIEIPKGSYIPEFHRIEEGSKLDCYSQFSIKGQSVRILHSAFIYQKRYSPQNYILSNILNSFFLFSEEPKKRDDNSLDIEIDLAFETEKLIIAAVFNGHTILKTIDMNEERWKEKVKDSSVPLVKKIIRNWINPDLRGGELK